MTIFNRAAACALLLILTLWIQCAGVAALIEWLKLVTAQGIYRFGSIRAAAGDLAAAIENVAVTVTK